MVHSIQSNHDAMDNSVWRNEVAESATKFSPTHDIDALSIFVIF